MFKNINKYIFNMYITLYYYIMKMYYYFRGLYRLKKWLKPYRTYYFKSSNKYYQYLGNGWFQPGQEIVDAGYIAIEHLPKKINLNTYSIGVIDMFEYNG